MPERGARDAVAAVEAAAEALFVAGKSWARFLKERQAEPGDRQQAEAEAIAGEIAKLRKSVDALAEHLQETISP
jgi:hypothetical protein